ncbi:MAG: flagellin [Planctomycetes bacterium]|nr:flagellin [Planctomycetota bacterium]
MTRIGSLSSLGTDQLRAIRRITEIGKAISQNQLRLSTLKRINSAKDDPSGLVAASRLEQELTAAETASKSVTRASAILSTADSAIGEIVSQLQQARTLALAAAGGTLSSDEVAANQVQIEAIIRQVDQLAQTSFGGRRLLDGSSGFRVSGADASTTLDVDVLDKQTVDDVTITITVDSTATQAANSYTSGALSSDTTLIITGPDGTTTLSLSNGDDTQDVTDAFNAITHLTGITATRIDANQIDFTTVDYGSAASIAIDVTAGSFALTTSGTVTGTDAVATINGNSVTGNGSTFNINTDNVSLVVELDPTASGTITPFTVSGEGLAFNIGVSPSSMARIGLPNLRTTSLGGITGKLSSILTGGANTLTGGNSTEALQIIDDAISDATRSQAIVGGFQKFTLDSASRVLDSQISNISSTLSLIQDVDVATESALLSRNLLLLQSTFESLSISNLRNQSVLSLLRRASF